MRVLLIFFKYSGGTSGFSGRCKGNTDGLLQTAKVLLPADHKHEEEADKDERPKSGKPPRSRQSEKTYVKADNGPCEVFQGERR